MLVLVIINILINVCILMSISLPRLLGKPWVQGMTVAIRMSSPNF